MCHPARGAPPPSDSAVIATNDEAFLCKVSSARAGYYADAYLCAMYRHACVGGGGDDGDGGGWPRRPPLINRGTYARIAAVERLVASFVRGCAERGVRAQIVSLGAGYDTLPFRLLARGGALRYVELDFASVVEAKGGMVAGVEEVSGLFSTLTCNACGGGVDGRTASGGAYALRGCDLRELKSVGEALDACGAERTADADTLFLTECVLMYMTPAASDALVGYATHAFDGRAAFVNYEPIRPDDAFGRAMVANIARRGSPLLGIDAYPTAESQRERFERCGWACVEAADMHAAFGAMHDFGERLQLNRVEVLDELEEWTMIMTHYVLVRAATHASPQRLLDELRLHKS